MRATGSCNYLNHQIDDEEMGAATVHITVVLKGLFCLPKQTDYGQYGYNNAPLG